MIQKMWECDDGSFEHQKPTIEDPKRIIALLLNIARGRAIIYGRRQIDATDIPMVVEIVLNSCPEDRGKIVRELLKLPACGYLTTDDVCTMLDITAKHALKTMENLKIVGICEVFEINSGVVGGRPSKAIRLNQDTTGLLGSNNIKQYFSNPATDKATQ